MKPALFLVPVLTCALVILSGCHSASRNPSKASAASTGGVTTTTALPSSSAPAAVTPPPASKVALPTIRINAGSGEVKDATGVAWSADTGFSGGDVVERPDLPIANTKQPEIYRSEHYSMESFAQKLPNGRYQVKLHFCETFEGITAPGERVFSFDVEGKTFKDFDVWVKAGGFARAYVETVDVDIADGQLDIKFTPNVENPQINAIEIIPLP